MRYYNVYSAAAGIFAMLSEASPFPAAVSINNQILADLISQKDLYIEHSKQRTRRGEQSLNAVPAIYQTSGVPGRFEDNALYNQVMISAVVAMRYYQDQCVRKNLFPEESKSIQGSDPQAYQGPWMLVITQVPNKDSQSPTLAHLLMPILAPAAGKNAKPTPRGEITARIPTKEDFDIIRRLPVRVYTPPGPNGGTYVLSKVLFDTHARLSIGIFDVNFIIKSVDEFEKSARDAALWHQENAGKDFLANGQPLTWYTQTFGLVQKSGSLIAPNWADV